MRIGIAGPVSVDLLADLVDNGERMPTTLAFPHVALLARTLHCRGHEITVFASSVQVPRQRVFAGERFKVVICPRRSRGRYMTLDLQSFERKQLQWAMSKSNCDVIHAHWTYEFALAALHSGRPTVTTAHDNPWQILWWYRHPYRVARLLMAREVARTAPVLTGVSPYVEAHWRRWMGYRGRFTVVANGLPADHFATEARVVAVGQDPIIIATLTGWGRRKNGENLIKAFALARRQVPAARLILYGDGHGQGEPAEACARSAGCLEAVECRGLRPYEEVQRALREEATLFVHPSREESFGLAQVEAMAAGLPVIGGIGSGAVPWTLGNGRAGFLTDVARPSTFAATLVEVMRRPDLANAKAASALSYSRRRFSIDAMAEQYLAIYRSTIVRNT